ncbi:hypothetical protein SAICODRAFT_45383, partial [Saitoella complicata NRRL Y-17804]
SIRERLPPRLQIADDWNLLYSLERDGASLGTLYRNCEAGEHSRAGWVFVVRAGGTEEGLFGAFVDATPRIGPTYTASGESFLYRSNPSTFEAWPSTNANSYHALFAPSYIAFGGGEGRNGLWLGWEGLETGRSEWCPSFGNEVL